MRPLLPRISRYRRIVAIGPRHSGKSVLLASLLDHLRKDPDRMLAARTGWVRHAVETYPGNLPSFPLDRILREAAEQAAWPEITVSPSALRFRALAGRQWKRDTVLDFIDIPGESLADLLGEDSFDRWSERVFELFPDPLDPPSGEDLRAYRAAWDEEQPAAADLAARYAAAVVEATRRGRYLATPSSLCARVFGDDAPEADDFGPRPPDARQPHPDIAAVFAERHRQHHSERVRPLERLLAEADVLVIPVDVGWILAGGPPVLRDQHALLGALGGLLERIDTIGSRLASFLGRSFTPLDDSLFPGRLRKVVFCATKIDLFRPADRSNCEDLVRRLAEPVLRGAGLHGIEVLFTACSAVRSTTESANAGSRLRGFRGGEPVEMEVPEIPEQWPDQWDPGQFRFPRLDPRIPRNGLYPPAHIHLDRVLRAILES